MLQQAIPVLCTNNIKATINFYETVLGFTATHFGNYAIFKKGTVELHFMLNTHNTPCGGACYIRVSDVQCLYTEMAARDLMYVENKLLDLPRGKKSFTITDNNGILLRFVQEY
jgi:catechol-2,3-dioxygenase